MKKHILYCNPGNGNLNWEKLYDVKNLPGKLSKYSRVKVTFEKYIPGKSLKQLGYYHSGILPFLEKQLYDDTGVAAKEWHHILKSEFGVKEDDKSGLFVKVKSHADYTEKEMSAYIQKVIDWALHFFQLQVPPPTVIDEYL